MQKLLDLGLIVFERQFSVTSQLALTKKGQLIGTPAYMSPEQCKGDEVTHLSDIYCMGLLAWELLSGRPVFESKNPAELFAMQLKKRPKPIDRVRKDVPSKISAAIGAALEKDPANRPQSARELFQAIRF
jgi:serine/threonine-protein kinase